MHLPSFSAVARNSQILRQYTTLFLPIPYSGQDLVELTLQPEHGVDVLFCSDRLFM